MEHLYILWTNDNVVTTEKMVFMYGVNSLLHGWWEEVTIILWGATPQLACENASIQKKIEEAKQAGVHLTACKACADELGVADRLTELGIEVKYWGKPLTNLLKDGERVLTI